jgi:hypothetical protein
MYIYYIYVAHVCIYFIYIYTHTQTSDIYKYIVHIRIFAYTSGSVAAFANFTAPQLAAIELTSGGTNEDQWFFDYQSGLLHFIGANIPSDAANAAKSLYIVGGRYIGDFGVVPTIIQGGSF